MPMGLISTDDFRTEAKRGARPDGTVFRLASGDSETVGDASARTERFVFSDESIDLAGDKIIQAGWDLGDFGNNPVALFSHMSWDPPIGRAHNVGVKNGKLIGDIEFAPKDTYDFADTIYRLVKGKFLKAVSVGFKPLEWAFTSDKDRPYGIDFKRQSLLEISVCCVPCNPNALNEARSAGIDTRPLVGWAEKVLECGAPGSILVPRVELESLRMAAKERPNRRRTAKSDDWTCSAARDFPVDENSAWDGAAAEKSIFDACGFDGDKPDTARAAKHFLAHDASAADLKGSYKLPFAKITDGKSEAVAAGLHAAASRLSGTDIPEGVKSSAQAVIDHYKTKMGDKTWRAMGEGGSGAALVPDRDCGESKDAECLFKDEQMCAVHYTPPEKTFKAGRSISARNKALLEEAMGHHEAMAKCIKDVLASDEPDADNDNNAPQTPQNEGEGDTHVVQEALSPEERRKREAQQLRDEMIAEGLITAL